MSGRVTPPKPGWFKRLLPRTLFGRALVIIVTPALLMQAVTAFIFYERHWDTMTRRLVWSVAGDIGLVLRQIDAADVAGSVVRLQDDAAALLDFGITYQPGVVLASNDREPRDYV